MGKVGYSDKINDPKFAKYYASTKKYSWIFAWVMAVAFVGGFTYAGETSREMDNPQAFYIGLGLGGMMLLIAFFSNRSREKSKTWDGVVVEHRRAKKKRRVNSSGNDYYIRNYELFTVVIQDQEGKKHEINVEDDMTLYDYYQDGDLVRHHGKLNTYEKYDKSKDKIIFCNACASLHEITEDVCLRCGCPLLK